MEEKTLLLQLEEAARHLSVPVRYESIESDDIFCPGGLCRVKGIDVIIINKHADMRQQIDTLVRALSGFDLSKVYLRPALRKFIENLEGEKHNLANE
ncbi:MAG: hypothetical protein JXD19_00315 [Deltaproteobacteria bacterium]|nr:hypothetical protein [Deltaproteobacteria bacterium]